MRRFLIHQVLPVLFCILPILGAVLVFLAVPESAHGEYLRRLKTSAIDWIILSLGSMLFVVQTLLAWQALRWKSGDFDTRPDRWLTHLAQAAEWFPLLGLIGTVAAILQTFTAVAAMASPDAKSIIEKYGPAITATGSGLFMALINILPTWVVSVGRDLIGSLAGQAPTPPPHPSAPGGPM